MLLVVLVAAGLVAITVAVHAVGFGLLFAWLMKSRDSLPTRTWPIAWLLVRVAWCLIATHVVGITVWALFYWWQRCMPTAEASFYFSGVTYTTLGYGDLLLPEHWRMLGPVEGLTGILMCGLSAGVFFAVATSIHTPRDRPK